MQEGKRSRARRCSEFKGTRTKALPSKHPYAYAGTGYHQHCPTGHYINTAADNSRNPHAQKRGTLTARKRLCAR